MIKATTLLIVVVFSFWFPPLVMAAEPKKNQPALRISAHDTPPYSNRVFTGYEDQVIREVFLRIGYAVIFKHQPGARSLLNLNDGVDDGTVSRIGGLSRTYTNLVQFTEKLEDRHYVAFTRRPDIKLAGWNDLAPYNVALINGWKIFERNVKQAKSITKTRNLRQLFMLLKKGRADVVLAHRWVGLNMARTLSINDVRMVPPPLAIREVFFYMNTKNDHLASKASAALKAMKMDGAFQRIHNRTIGLLIRWYSKKINRGE